MEGAELIQAHQSAKKRLRLLRIFAPLVIILIVVVNIYALVEQVRNVDTEALAREMEGQFHQLWPRIEDDMAMVANNLVPVLEGQLQKSAAALGPKLDRRLEKDVENLKVQVQRDFERELTKAVEEIETRQRNVLIEHIPDLKGDKKAQDRVLEQVRVSLVKWAMNQLTDTLHEHMVAMEQIRKTLQRSYIAGPGAKADAEEAIFIWLDLMNEAVGGDSTILAPAPDAKKKSKKSGK